MIVAKDALPPAGNIGVLKKGNDNGFVFKRGTAKLGATKAVRAIGAVRKQPLAAAKGSENISAGNLPEITAASSYELVGSKSNENASNISPGIKRPAAQLNSDNTKLDFPEPKRRLTISDSADGMKTPASKAKGYVEAEVVIPARKPTQPTPLISRTRTRIVEGTPKSPKGAVAGRRSTSRRQTSTNGNNELPMRNKRKSTMGGNRRRSTFSMRGKRASSIGGGFKALPHDSVSSGDFYRHISPELPEPIRLRQLLAWCARRQFATSDWPAELPDAVKKILNDSLKEAVDDVHLAFEKGDIATSWYHRPMNEHSELAGDTKGELQKHPENVKNLETKELLLKRIEALKKENNAWVKELKRASTQHAKTLDRLPKSIRTLPAAAAAAASSTGDVDIEPISRSANSFDWSPLTTKDSEDKELAIKYVMESNAGGISMEIEKAEEQIEAATREIEIQLDSFHLDMHRANEQHEFAKNKCEKLSGDLSFALAQRREKALALAGISRKSTAQLAQGANEQQQETADDTRDLLRTLAAALANDN
ncbi:hypothetical protein GGI12_005324 [Dipsacomyces acuminosporus]|nr:hypothetical protein GGI12_005324 [Dipsacomyces acuminosporus]